MWDARVFSANLFFFLLYILVLISVCFLIYYLFIITKFYILWDWINNYRPYIKKNNQQSCNYFAIFISLTWEWMCLYSYSSVSVSPTQFSPTHSPIQGRHLHRPNNGFPSPVLSSRPSQDFSVQGTISILQLHRFLSSLCNWSACFYCYLESILCFDTVQ